MRGRKAVPAVALRRRAGYCRCSHIEQVEGGLTLEVQQSRLRAYAVGTGTTLDDFYIDAGISAGTMKRPELQRLLEAVSRGEIEAIYVTKLDRLSRNLSDLLEMVRLFDRHCVSLVSASESIDSSGAAGRMMLQLLGVFAEFERGRTSERIREVLGERRRVRKAYSRCTPFGYTRFGDKLVENEQQQSALADARRMKADGASLRQIAKRLTELGVCTNNGGKQWYAETVRQILFSRIGSDAATKRINNYHVGIRQFEVVFNLGGVCNCLRFAVMHFFIGTAEVFNTGRSYALDIIFARIP